MESSKIYIATYVIALVLIGLLLFVKQRKIKNTPVTPLNGLAYSCILAGIIFGDSRFIGYGLIAIGVLLSVIDIIKIQKIK